ncbi:putative acyl--CoA ligase YhfT [Curvibacter sp. AEP1-3]|uniref:AMP-binding protein n=1 Tax=Curvibacter sp. AEP1-3 TaxID=1844971 RepID=UPI000B3C6689|nr:AMP-binding protein [Curvibacter sp. AEP1-3]ARV18844.1 putative acyl--CoA ligase YhfT [Curvibacter sp. AEP1-3]
MPETPELVHSRLSRWARDRGTALAIQSEAGNITFAELAQQVQAHAEALSRSCAPATVLQDSGLPLLQRLTAFLGTIASGRCAAVSDPAWPEVVLTAVRANLPDTPCDSAAPIPLSPFYTGFTSGSTGLPKGFRRHHRSWTESFALCLSTFGDAASTRILAPGRDSHSLFLFGMLLGLWTGAGVVVQEQFSASAALATLTTGQTPCLVAVPSQLLLMLELAAHRQLPPVRGVRLILISGARWTRSRTPDLQALFPEARIIEFYGASETSFIAWTESHPDLPDPIVGRPFDNVELDVRGATPDSPDGLIYVRSPMVFMDYVGASHDHTAALRDGDWVCVRDLGHLDAQGRLWVAGRESRMLVTMAKKLFPEELEAVLEAHPAVARASVHGLPDAQRGVQIVAIIQWATGSERADLHALQSWCRSRLEAFKVPRQLWVHADWAFTASGKTDHPTLSRNLPSHLHEAAPCLTPLR